MMDMEDYDEEIGSSSVDEDEGMDVENGSGGSDSDNEAESDEDDISSITKSKKKRKRKTLELDAKGKPKLSSKQIKELQETEVLGQSNLYRFQVSSISVNSSWRKVFIFASRHFIFLLAI